MNPKPLISVVVASYNYEKYIRETLDSLVLQTDKDFEVIVVDDGSKDNSRGVIGLYASKHNNIHLHTHPEAENQGLAATVKLGIEKATGEWIAFCESDDYWREDHVSCLRTTIAQNPHINMIINGVKILNFLHHNRYESYVNFSSRLLKDHSGYNIFPLMSDNQIPTFSAVCVRKSVVEQCDFDSPCKAWLDFWLWRQVCLSNAICFIPEQITLWRKHNESYDVTFEDKDYEGFIQKSNQLLKIKYGEINEPSNTKLRNKKFPKLWVKLACLFFTSEGHRRYLKYKYIK